MATYTVMVNGRNYEVEIEKKGNASGAKAGATSGTASVPPAKTQAQAVPAVPCAPAAQESKGSTIKAPMPGKIIAIRVSIGESIEKGQEVLVLEAMKMHNPVVAVEAGVIKKIYVKVGDAVRPGANLFFIQ